MPAPKPSEDGVSGMKDEIHALTKQHASLSDEEMWKVIEASKSRRNRLVSKNNVSIVGDNAEVGDNRRRGK